MYSQNQIINHQTQLYNPNVKIESNIHDQSYSTNITQTKQEMNIKHEYNIKQEYNNTQHNSNLNISDDDPEIDYVYVEDCDENNYVPN